MGSSFSVGSDSSMACTTLLSARAAAAARHAAKPTAWNCGSPPLARTTPITMGTRVRYVARLSREPGGG
jgi:hypothetical protein